MYFHTCLCSDCWSWWTRSNASLPAVPSEPFSLLCNKNWGGSFADVYHPELRNSGHSMSGDAGTLRARFIMWLPLLSHVGFQDPRRSTLWPVAARPQSIGKEPRPGQEHHLVESGWYRNSWEQPLWPCTGIRCACCGLRQVGCQGTWEYLHSVDLYSRCDHLKPNSDQISRRVLIL